MNAPLHAPLIVPLEGMAGEAHLCNVGLALAADREGPGVERECPFGDT